MALARYVQFWNAVVDEIPRGQDQAPIVPDPHDHVDQAHLLHIAELPLDHHGVVDADRLGHGYGDPVNQVLEGLAQREAEDDAGPDTGTRRRRCGDVDVADYQSGLRPRRLWTIRHFLGWLCPIYSALPL